MRTRPVPRRPLSTPARESFYSRSFLGYKPPAHRSQPVAERSRLGGTGSPAQGKGQRRIVVILREDGRPRYATPSSRERLRETPADKDGSAARHTRTRERRRRKELPRLRPRDF